MLRPIVRQLLDASGGKIKNSEEPRLTATGLGRVTKTSASKTKVSVTRGAQQSARLTADRSGFPPGAARSICRVIRKARRGPKSCSPAVGLSNYQRPRRSCPRWCPAAHRSGALTLIPACSRCWHAGQLPRA
jgi:hypothetical protein